jgi:hypothetical protein
LGLGYPGRSNAHVVHSTRPRPSPATNSPPAAHTTSEEETTTTPSRRKVISPFLSAKPSAASLPHHGTTTVVVRRRADGAARWASPPFSLSSPRLHLPLGPFPSSPPSLPLGLAFLPAHRAQGRAPPPCPVLSWALCPRRASDRYARSLPTFLLCEIEYPIAYAICTRIWPCILPLFTTFFFAKFIGCTLGWLLPRGSMFRCRNDWRVYCGALVVPTGLIDWLIVRNTLISVDDGAQMCGC